MKKGSVEIGGTIIGIAVLLLLFGIFMEGDSSTQQPSTPTNYDNSILFQFNNTELGRQQVVTQSFPNIVLGAETEYTTIHRESLIELRSNPFYQSEVSMTINPRLNRSIDEYLVYASPSMISGSNRLEVYVGDKLVGRYSVTGNSFPIPLRNLPSNSSSEVTFSLERPFFLNLFSWNRAELEDFRLVEVSRDDENKKRAFDFQVDRDFLDSTAVELVISCRHSQEISEAIKVEVNGYIVSNENPDCLSRYTTISADVPENILKERNRLELETSGFYTLAYSIQTIHFNDRQRYSFTLSDFDNLNDIVMYGDFDRDVIDIRLNGNTMSLDRNEIKSILPYLRIGRNEITFLTQPIEFREFVIEKNVFS